MMIRSQPHYFDAVFQGARKLWIQLESNAELARPFWLLFEQIQSPRHVISELLQNAEDACATWARVSIEGDEFLFEHDGRDFDEDDFRSLCRFGLSSKRSLFTIGFRGIGFKSVFSLGSSITLVTPTLACRFNKARFTEPEWLSEATSTDHTTIRVRIENDMAREAILESIDSWRSSPVPLLLFENVKALTLDDFSVTTEVLGAGPCGNSRRVRLVAETTADVIVFRSEPEAFPDECISEVAKERWAEDLSLPPIQVSIILGEGTGSRLYAFLPTEVHLDFPGSFQAPFLQDPARIRIKEPASSPTNRWLLSRLGRLLGESLISWLSQVDLGVEERAEAYQLFPKKTVNIEGFALDVSQRMVEGFLDATRDQPVVLCSDEGLSTAGSVADIPQPLLRTWGVGGCIELFALKTDSALSESVSESDAKKLIGWEVVKEVSSTTILDRLMEDRRPPMRPERLETLIPLWAYIHSLVSGRWEYHEFWSQGYLVPSSSRDRLCRKSELVAAPQQPENCEENDWAFLVGNLSIVDPRWVAMVNNASSKTPEFLASLEAALGCAVDEETLSRFVKASNSVGVQKGVRLQSILNHVAAAIFGKTNLDAADAIRFVLIVFRLRGKLTDDLVKVQCVDGIWRSRDQGVIADVLPEIETLLPESLAQTVLLSDRYEQSLESAEIRAWRDWIVDTRGGGINSFPMPVALRLSLYGKWDLEEFCRERGSAPPSLELKTPDFTIDDFDWPTALLEHWEATDKPDDPVWPSIARSMLESWSSVWVERSSARIYQEGRQYQHRLYGEAPRSKWLERLQAKQCVLDEYGRARLPAELLRVTPETQALVNIEDFIHPDWDKPMFHPGLNKLGVRSEATSVEGIIRRLVDLSKTENPTIPQLADLYRAIDRALIRDEKTAQSVFEAFRESPIVRTTDGWAKIGNVFRENPDDIPGVSVIPTELQDRIHLWEHLGVPAVPTSAHAIAWISALPRAKPLPPGLIARVRRVLRRYSSECWVSQRVWINLRGMLCDVANLRWVVLSRPRVRDLFPNLLDQVGDLSFLKISEVPDFFPEPIPVLDGSLRRRVIRVTSVESEDHDELQQQLRKLGQVLEATIVSTGDEIVQTDLEACRRLSQCRIVFCRDLRVQYYLDDRPVGPEAQVASAWDGDQIFTPSNPASAYDSLVREISRTLASAELRIAVRDCLFRPTQFIENYALAHLGFSGNKVGNGDAAVESVKDSGATRSYGDDQAQATTALGPSSRRAATEPTKRTRRKRETLKDLLIRLLETEGFARDAMTGTIRHPDGRILEATDGVFRYWLTNGDEETPLWLSWTDLDEGLVVPSEVWDSDYANKAVLITFKVGRATRIAFSEIMRLVSEHRVEVFASQYRLRTIRRTG